MYLLVKKNGHKYWHLDYRFRGKRKTLALGVYPEVSLKDAREKRRQARLQLEKGQDSAEIRKENKRMVQTNRFRDVAHQWWEHCRGTWTPDHAARVLKRLDDNAFRDLGNLSIDLIDGTQLCILLKDLKLGVETQEVVKPKPEFFEAL